VILLFGTKSFQTIVTLVTFVCSQCGVNAPQHVFKRALRFTLFFIPLFSFSTSYFVECSNCGATTALTREQAMHSVEWAERH
jgi:ABC-type multidrug transport system permease subunit